MLWHFLLIAVIATTEAMRSLDIIKMDLVTPEKQAVAVKNLAGRLLGEDSNFFVFIVDPSIVIDGKDTYQLLKTDNDVVVSIKGSSGVAAAAGLLKYLKLCGCHVSWDGDQLQLPGQLPAVNITSHAMDQFRYYQNVCTASYSAVWWGWQRWEREIDWMALNGINLALAHVGQEAVWQAVFKDFGLTQQEIDAFFAGPAFLAWNRMGNLRGWLGPLPPSWHEQTISLQKRIVKRMTQFGITPVVPAFTGILPRAFSRIFPQSNFTKINKWNGFPDKYCCPYLLSPIDPAFQDIGTAFLKKYEAMFGLYHVYNCDTFNENEPTSGDLSYLKQIGQGIFGAMKAVDEDAVWLLQGWMFYSELSFWSEERTEALLTSVPLGRILVLDLQSELNPQYERLNSYYGQPFIWCMLHNFGGTLGLHGATDRLNQVPYDVRNNQSYSMVGIGLTPEGINTNYVIYDFMLEVGWNKKPVDIDQWFKSYARRRYGASLEEISTAWIHLRNSVYNYTSTVPEHGRYIITSRPKLTLQKDVWYDPTDIYKSFEALLKANSSITAGRNTYLHDLIDVGRQTLQILFDEAYENLISTYNNREIKEFQMYAMKMMDLLKDMEAILETQESFLLGKWITDARLLGTNEKEKDQYEINARNQITLWGPDGQIVDYANKQWSGIMKDYYSERWAIFLTALNSSLVSGSKFNQTKVDEEMFTEVELKFSRTINPNYPTEPSGDPVSRCEEILSKWLNIKK